MDSDQFSISLANYHPDKLFAKCHDLKEKRNCIETMETNFFFFIFEVSTLRCDKRFKKFFSSHNFAWFRVQIRTKYFNLQTWKYYRKIELDYELNGATSLFRSDNSFFFSFTQPSQLVCIKINLDKDVDDLFSFSISMRQFELFQFMQISIDPTSSSFRLFNFTIKNGLRLIHFTKCHMHAYTYNFQHFNRNQSWEKKITRKQIQ